MKSTFLLTVMALTFTVSVYAISGQNTFIKTDTAKQVPINKLLDYYYNIKDALANSNAVASAQKAGNLVNAIQNINMKSLTNSEHKAFMPLKDILMTEAKSISQSKNLAKQRIYFASLSDNFYLLAKEVKLTTQPIYRDYCPMKKKYWLSNEKTIRNPYYGKAMPTCGSIKETLK